MAAGRCWQLLAGDDVAVEIERVGQPGQSGNRSVTMTASPAPISCSLALGGGLGGFLEGADVVEGCLVGHVGNGAV
jgi:hypothetical protein